MPTLATLARVTSQYNFGHVELVAGSRDHIRLLGILLYCQPRVFIECWHLFCFWWNCHTFLPAVQKLLEHLKSHFDGQAFVSLLVFIVRTVSRGHLGRRADEHLSTVRVAMQTTSSLCYHWPSSCYKNVWRLRHHKALLSNDRPQSLDTHSTYMRDWQIVPKMLDILLRKPLYVYNYEYPSNRFML